MKTDPCNAVEWCGVKKKIQEALMNPPDLSAQSIDAIS